MIWSRYEPFIGFRLLVFENRLVDRGYITECLYSRDGVITFTTATGTYSFYYQEPREMVQLKSGDWKLFGDTPRWAYVCQPDRRWTWYR